LLLVLRPGLTHGAAQSFTVSGVTLSLDDVSPELEVRYQSMRLNRAQNVWNVEVVLTNKGSRVLRGPFALQVESFSGTSGPQDTDGNDGGNPARPFFDLSGSVADGALSPQSVALRLNDSGLDSGAFCATYLPCGRNTFSPAASPERISTESPHRSPVVTKRRRAIFTSALTAPACSSSTAAR
jgi:hypothetical protein